MANKTYNQYCALAHALDIVGERWTLLIVRNLMVGPKRFSDLLKGLPGISTNILTDRLKSLEENGVVINRYLPPPAASSVYQLTRLGFGLGMPLAALAKWGAYSFKEADQKVVPESVMFMILGMFWREQAEDIDLTCNVHVADERHDHNYWVHLSSDNVKFLEAHSDAADVTLHLALQPLHRLSGEQISFQSAIEQGLVQLDGEQSNIDKLVAWINEHLE
ncbi:MAG: winged helix-turn-helix transcriptional regulator [Chloroflexota bacterium]|nr:winged helix-turn-helix transcriptional regulator [Chloroflexota bacterium]